MSQQQSSNSLANQDTSISGLIAGLNQPSMFWQPDFRQDSAWLEHAPFLFWLIEGLEPRRCVGIGVDVFSHMAACQAISSLHLDAHAYLVGEASTLDKDALNAKELALEKYPATSHWLEATPTKAIQQFEEGSIDLLLLNVNSDDDSVDYLLDRWMSRLSPSAVVLLPGIAMREPGSRVFRTYEALKAQHRHFTFHHGAGLGVLAVGQALPKNVSSFLTAGESSTSSSLIQEIFARLGRGCKDSLGVHKLQQNIEDIESKAEVLFEQVTSLEAQRKEAAEQVKLESSNLSELKVHFERQEDRFAHERGRLAERVSSLEEVNHELKEEVARQRNQAEHHAQEVREDRNTLLAQLSENERSLASALEALSQVRDEAKTQLEAFENVKKKLNSSDDALKKERETSKSLEGKLHTQALELEKSKQAETTRFQELAKLTELLESNKKELDQQCEKAKKVESLLETQQKENTAHAKDIERLKRQLAQQTHDAKAFADERFRELAVLTDLLEKREAEYQPEIDSQAREIGALLALLDERGIDYSSVILPASEPEALSEPSNTPITAPLKITKAPPLTKRSIKRQVALIETSRYFDAKWYLSQYPDVARDAKMSADPARHYLLMGGFEGRNPGPEFDSAFYLSKYSDVLESGINPLVHYIKFGEKEQREINQSV